MIPRAAVLVAVALVGCASTQATPPVMPAITEITEAQSQFSRITDPQAFFRTAAAQIMMNCTNYFDQLVTIAQRNAQTSTQIAGASQALAAILGLAQAAPGPVSVLGVVGPAVTGAIANAQAGSPGGDHPAEMSTLVAAEMNAYLAAIGNPPADAAGAWLAAYGLFRTCSPAGIESAKQQALADAPNHIAVVGASPPDVSPTAEPHDLAPRRAPAAGVPLVIVHSPASAPTALAQAASEAELRKLQLEWLAIQRLGRNAAAGGPRYLPAAKPFEPPRTHIEDAPQPPPSTSWVHEMAPDLDGAAAPLPLPDKRPKRKL